MVEWSICGKLKLKVKCCVKIPWASKTLQYLAGSRYIILL